MLKREILLTGCAIVLALSGHETLAAEACTTVPTCAELGYTQTDCEGFVSLKCPFDKNKLFCGSTCLSGYTYGQITKKCGTRNPDIIYMNGMALAAIVSSNLAIAMADEESSTWADAVAKCKAKAAGGKSWRIPNLTDIQIIQSKFIELQNNLSSYGDKLFGEYWIGRRQTSTTSGYWDATNGILDYDDKTKEKYVRCVLDI